jgi:hypothetical protein
MIGPGHSKGRELDQAVERLAHRMVERYFGTWDEQMRDGFLGDQRHATHVGLRLFGDSSR